MRRRQHHLAGESSVEAYAVDRSTADQLGAAMSEVMRTLSETRRQILVDVIVNNLSASEIATKRGISKRQVRSEFNWGISSMRHPSRSQMLAGHTGLSGPMSADAGPAIDQQVLRHILAGSALGLDGITVNWTECDLHGWQQVLSTAAKCHGCPCELPRGPDAFGYALSESGRPRKYCCDACRQRAYRRRKKQS